jgi:hypothetical protein
LSSQERVAQSRFHQYLVAVGLVTPFVTALLYLEFTWLGFMTPVQVAPWIYILFVFVLLSISVTPVSIAAYFIDSKRIQRTSNKRILVGLEVLFYGAYLAAPIGVYLPLVAGAFLFIVPPLIAFLVGLGIQRIELASAKLSPLTS